MKKNFKIFKAGNYPQGDFSIDKLEKIVLNTKDAIVAQFAHTSKLKKEPVVIGEFTNVLLKGDEVFADFEFNDTGKDFYDKGIIDGISVEIKEGAFDRVAGLPVGVNPAIQGAEFSEQYGYYVALEFETEIEEEKEEITLTLKEQLKGASVEEKKEILADLQAEFEEKPAVKTEAEIVAETEARMTAEFEMKEKKTAFLAKAEGIKPALKPIVAFCAEALFTVENVNNTIEFEEDGKKVEKNMVEEFGAILDTQKVPKNGLGGVEFEIGQGNGEKTQDDYKKIAEELSK